MNDQANQQTEATPVDRKAVVEFVRNPQTGEYVSTCGRFRIWHDRYGSTTRGRWHVVDNNRPDPCCPECYPKHIVTNHTLASCKYQANRWARGFTL